MISNWTANTKMKKLLNCVSACTDAEILQLNPEQLKRLFFPPFQKVKDCIIISDKSSHELEATFDDAIQMYADKTGYEASNTETRINCYFENHISMITGTQIALMVVEAWKLKLKQMSPGDQFCLIVCSDEERVEIRFHKVRDREGLWLADDIESYKDDAVGCIFI